MLERISQTSVLKGLLPKINLTSSEIRDFNNDLYSLLLKFNSVDVQKLNEVSWSDVEDFSSSLNYEIKLTETSNPESRIIEEFSFSHSEMLMQEVDGFKNFSYEKEAFVRKTSSLWVHARTISDFGELGLDRVRTEYVSQVIFFQGDTPRFQNVFLDEEGLVWIGEVISDESGFTTPEGALLERVRVPNLSNLDFRNQTLKMPQPLSSEIDSYLYGIEASKSLELKNDFSFVTSNNLKKIRILANYSDGSAKNLFDSILEQSFTSFSSDDFEIGKYKSSNLMLFNASHDDPDVLYYEIDTEYGFGNSSSLETDLERLGGFASEITSILESPIQVNFNIHRQYRNLINAFYSVISNYFDGFLSSFTNLSYYGNPVSGSKSQIYEALEYLELFKTILQDDLVKYKNQSERKRFAVRVMDDAEPSFFYFDSNILNVEEYSERMSAEKQKYFQDAFVAIQQIDASANEDSLVSYVTPNLVRYNSNNTRFEDLTEKEKRILLRQYISDLDSLRVEELLLGENSEKRYSENAEIEESRFQNIGLEKTPEKLADFLFYQSSSVALDLIQPQDQYTRPLSVARARRDFSSLPLPLKMIMKSSFSEASSAISQDFIGEDFNRLENIETNYYNFSLIRRIEFLEINVNESSIWSEWKMMTSDKINDIPLGEVLMCRTKAYSNTTFNLSGKTLNESKIGQKYFIITNLLEANSPQESLPTLPELEILEENTSYYIFANSIDLELTN